MANQDIRGDTPQVTNEKASDILLVMDKKELSVSAVSEIDKDGKAKTVPAKKENQNAFLKIDCSTDVVSNFLSNFWSQATDPSRFRLFRSSPDTLEEDKKTLDNPVQGKETPETGKFLEKNEIKPEEVANKENINNQTENVMAKQEQRPVHGQATENGNSTPKYRTYSQIVFGNTE